MKKEIFTTLCFTSDYTATNDSRAVCLIQKKGRYPKIK